MRWFPPRKPLSPHFTWAEVIAKSGYARVPLGPMILPNFKVVTPRRNARKQAAALERLRASVNAVRAGKNLAPTGIRLNSFARSWSHNKQVGGATDSQHLYFRACDITVQEIDRLFPWHSGRADFDALLDVVFHDGGVGLYPAGNRHADTRGHRARWTSF